MIKDGWHKFYDKWIYAENEKVIRATIKDSGNYITCYPYEKTKDDAWRNISGKVTLSAFRSGYKRGTKILK